MKDIKIGKMDKFIIHFVGNKNNGDGVKFSDVLTAYTDIEEHLMQLLNGSLKTDELYQFHFFPNLELNPVYQLISSIFQNNETFIDQSKI